MKPSFCIHSLKLLAGLAVCLGAFGAHGQFTYYNNNQGATFVPYGGSYTYSISWTNGTYPFNNQTGTWVNTFIKPSGSIPINALYPVTGSFTYTIPYVTSSDEGSYYMNLNGDGSGSFQTTPVFLHVTPTILVQPSNTVAASGQYISMGLIAGPTSSTYTWYNAATGAQVAGGSTFPATTSLNGQWIYCKVSNQYGYTISSPALLTLASSPFSYQNNDPGVQIVPYGGTYTYSVSWTNGTYPQNGQLGTFVNSFSKPSGSISINALYPSAGSFTYTIPYVTGSDDGSYTLTLNGTGGSTVTTTAVAVHVSPSILAQPTNTLVVGSGNTSMGLIAGPTTGLTYTWYNAATGVQVASGLSFFASTGSSLNGQWLYCKISNQYGYTVTQPALLTVITSLFSYQNNNPGVQIVPYGGAYTYTVSWTNGTYSQNGQLGTYVNTFFKPSGSISFNTLYPSAGSFTYTIPFVTSTDDGGYTLSMNGSLSGSLTTASVFLRVAPSIILQPVETTVANNVSTSMGMVAGPSTATFTWFDTATGNVVASGSSFQANSSMDGKRIYCKISNTYDYTISAPVLIHIGPAAPTITSQPTNLTVVLGQAATFSVKATGTPPLSYAWFHNGFQIAGAAQSFISILATTNSDAGFYSCMVSNAQGSTNSASPTLAFATFPVITAQPQSLTVTQGQAAVFSAAATGAPVNFYWKKNGVTIFGATNTTFVISNAAATDMATYTFVASNGLAAVSSTGAVLTVYSAPVILTQPMGGNVSVGTDLNLSVNAIGYPALSYQWFLNTAAIGGATNPIYDVPSASYTDAGNYTVVVTNSSGSVTSSIANVTVSTTGPAITMQPVDMSAVLGSPAAFPVSATGSLLNYQWYKFSTNQAGAVAIMIDGFVLGGTVTNAGGGYAVVPNVQIAGGGGSGAVATATVSNGMVTAINISNPGSGYTSAPAILIDPPAVALAGQTTATLNLPAVGTNDAGIYFVVVTNVVGSVTSSNAMLTVNVPVYIVTQPASQTVTVGGTANFAVTVAGDAPYAYQWFEVSTNQATATALTLNGFVYGANVTSGGAGYVTTPNVQIIGGGGSGAQAMSVVSNGVVTGVIVTIAGAGYTNVPVIQIDPPTGVALAGQTGANFSIVGVSNANVGNYYVIVTNNYGSVTSLLASLTINNNSSNVVFSPNMFQLSGKVNPAGMQLTYTGTPNSSYVLLAATNLVPPVVWQPVCTNTADTNGVCKFTDTNLVAPQKFYRTVSGQ